jgi:hypothetical protein
MATLTQRLGIRKVDEFLIGDIELGLDIYLNEAPSKEIRRELFEDMSKQLKEMFPQLMFDEPTMCSEVGEPTPRIVSNPYEIGLEVRYMHGGEEEHGLVIRTLGGINYNKTKQFFSYYKKFLKGEH